MSDDNFEKFYTKKEPKSKVPKSEPEPKDGSALEKKYAKLLQDFRVVSEEKEILEKQDKKSKERIAELSKMLEDVKPSIEVGPEAQKVLCGVCNENEASELVGYCKYCVERAQKHPLAHRPKMEITYRAACIKCRVKLLGSEFPDSPIIEERQSLSDEDVLALITERRINCTHQFPQGILVELKVPNETNGTRICLGCLAVFIGDNKAFFNGEQKALGQ